MREEYRKYTEAADTDEKAVTRLMEIIDILRKECPWDKVQTHDSLTPCMIEEAYEAVDAIRKKDDENLREELGDVMMQVIFHSSLAKSEGLFTFKDVVNEECEKMIRRHPHIFADGSAKTVDKVLEKWENIKCEEHRGLSETSRLMGVPGAFPALIRSAKVQKKAARVGFDFNSAEGACEKLQEETQELIDACRQHDHVNISEEIGDMLFTVVNVSRFLDVEPEGALRSATEKFIRRFGSVELQAEALGRSLEEMDIDEMNKLWEKAKAEEDGEE